MNQQPTLAQRVKEDAPEAGPSTEVEQVKEAYRRQEIMRVTKNKTERERRGAERQALERISLLFRTPRTWAKQKLLTLGKIISVSISAANCLPSSFQFSSSFSTALQHSPKVPSRFAPAQQGRRCAVVIVFPIWTPVDFFDFLSLGSHLA